MMDRYYSKSALLQWVRTTTQRPIKDIEELSTGVHFAVLLNVLTSGKFSLQKINMNAKLEYENLNNLKQLLYGLRDEGVRRNFQITKIANKNIICLLDMLKWFRKRSLDLLENQAKSVSKSKQKLIAATTSKKGVIEKRENCGISDEDAMRIILSNFNKQPQKEVIYSENYKEEDTEIKYPSLDNSSLPKQETKVENIPNEETPEINSSSTRKKQPQPVSNQIFNSRKENQLQEMLISPTQTSCFKVIQADKSDIKLVNPYKQPQYNENNSDFEKKSVRFDRSKEKMETTIKNNSKTKEQSLQSRHKSAMKAHSTVQKLTQEKKPERSVSPKPSIFASMLSPEEDFRSRMI